MINQRILRSLTEEQRHLLHRVREEWMQTCESFDREPDTGFVVGYFHRLYRAAGLKRPNVHIFEGPKSLAKYLRTQPQEPHGTMGLAEILEQAADRDFCRRIGQGKRHDDEFFFCFARSGFWHAQTYPKDVFVCLAPKVIRTGAYRIVRFRDGAETIYNAGNTVVFGRGIETSKQVH